jgi:cellulose synthase/poly-beta-1,6-N-acetylglucosamine synthase-like glycosyltransferase
MHWIIIAIYGLALSFTLAYSLVQLYLVFMYRKSKPQRPETRGQRPEMCLENEINGLGNRPSAPNQNLILESNYPSVTVQLPVYNEKYVVERLLESISKLDYPKRKLEIQLLDDSTDESYGIAATKLEELKALGIDIKHIHRTDRSGYKAGALSHGLKQCKGDLIAIFDADFMPKPDFLKRLIPHFKEEKLGMVQSRWGHINRHYSLLTDLQAFGLDAHFSVEQGGRNAGNHFINFNGTAGIWRKQTILDAGGWSADTLTEDLDLSYRAQLKGWKFLFEEAVEAPAELPAEMNALKNQQYRWNKGAAECMRKNLPKVLSAKELSFSTKLNAVFHLMNSSIFICVILLALLSVPLLWIKFQHPELSLLFKLATIFLIALPILAVFYWTSEQKRDKKGGFWSFLVKFPAFLSISMGLALHNAIAVAEGYLGRKTPFVRTPKFNLSEQKGNADWIKNIYLNRSLSPLVFAEIAMALYALFGIYLAIQLQDFGLLPFHLLLFFGFTYVSFTSIQHMLKISNELV